jgi:hypothetical protein
MAQWKLDDEGENQVCTEVGTNLVAYGLFCYCVNLGYEKWVEQFVSTELYNELTIVACVLVIMCRLEAWWD